MISKYQKTFKNTIYCVGTGLHSGEKITMVFHPAPINHGIVFKRTDVFDKDNIVPARYDLIGDTRLCSCLVNKDGVAVSTIEHLMAALHALEISNALIEIDGAEVPIMDGSSSDYVFLIESVGVQTQEALQPILKIKKEVKIENKGAVVTLSPSDKEVLSMDFEIDFPSKIIGKEEISFDLTPENFKNEVAYARTFCSAKDIEMMHQMGLARGGSLDNALVVDGDSLMNTTGLRAPKEFVRHKLLDSIGDLYQAGMPIFGHFSGHFSGHALNNQLLRKLFEDKSAYEIITIAEPVSDAS